jgi:hypothetical protein
MLVGAVTVLVTIIAVFLSYNANEGLPFVPSYPLEAEVPDAAGLVRGNEVRIGGARAGVVSEISTRSHRDGSVSAVLKLELEPSLRPLPADSTLMVRRARRSASSTSRSPRAARGAASTTTRRSPSRTSPRSPSRSTRSSTCSTARRGPP